VPSPPPAGYDDSAQVVEVDSKLTETQFRHIEKVLGHPRYWLGRYKSYATKAVFTPSTPAIAAAVCKYLREQQLPHEHEIAYRWAPAAKASRARRTRQARNA
jgi:hypothetical protein